MYIENENKYAYEVMQNIGYVNVLNIEKKKVEPMTSKEFESIQSRNWSKEPQHVLFQTLSSLSMYCSQNNICISNKLFDDYVDNLTDKVKFATDEELKTLFHSLSQFPATESIKTRNYIEIWAALDDECFHRINKWSFDEMLTFLSLFYMLNVIRILDELRKPDRIEEIKKHDVKRVLQLMRGGENFVTGHHIVTHHQRGDIIICNDHEGRPLPVKEAFSKSQFGLLCSPPDENIWTVLIIAGRNTMIHNSASATGHFTSKVRELKTLGYNAELVMWNVYDKLTNDEEKIKYLNKLIKDSVNTELKNEMNI
ncbi:unnamed protein product, partial [Brenthis ino]